MPKTSKLQVSKKKRYVALAIAVLAFGSYIRWRTLPIEEIADIGAGSTLLVTDVIPLDRPDYEQYGQQLFNVYMTNVGDASAIDIKNQYAFATNLDKDGADKVFHEIDSALTARRNEGSSDEIPKNASRHFSVVTNKFQFDYAESGKNVLYLLIVVEYRDKTPRVITHASAAL
jgi:hypothetical protein